MPPPLLFSYNILNLPCGVTAAAGAGGGDCDSRQGAEGCWQPIFQDDTHRLVRKYLIIRYLPHQMVAKSAPSDQSSN